MLNTDKKLGVAMTTCFICGEPKQIVMNTRLTSYDANKIEKMHMKCIDYEPCDKCKELMKQGIILISVRDGETGENPYRTGCLCLVEEDALKDIIAPDAFKEINKKRVAFIEDSTWDRLGLPRGEQ